MSRKDFIIIADAMVAQINNGCVKKKDVDDFIAIMRNRLTISSNTFQSDTFTTYIKERV